MQITSRRSDPSVPDAARALGQRRAERPWAVVPTF